MIRSISDNCLHKYVQNTEHRTSVAVGLHGFFLMKQQDVRDVMCNGDENRSQNQFDKWVCRLTNRTLRIYEL